MAVEGNFFTRVAYNFAAILLIFSFAAGLTACGNSDSKAPDPYEDPVALQKAGDQKLREAIDMEPAMANEQLFMDVSDYRRADAVYNFQQRAQATPTDTLVRWHDLLALYNSHMSVANRAVDQKLIFFQGPGDAVSNRVQTASAYLQVVNIELSARGIR